MNKVQFNVSLYEKLFNRIDSEKKKIEEQIESKLSYSEFIEYILLQHFKIPLSEISDVNNDDNKDNIEDVVDYKNSSRNLIEKSILYALNHTKTIRDAAIKLGFSERTLFRKVKDMNILYQNGEYDFSN